MPITKLDTIVVTSDKQGAEDIQKVPASVSAIPETKLQDEHIKKVESLIDSKDKVIDETVITNTKEATKKAGAEKLIVKKRPFKTSEIKKDTEKYSTPPDYSENINLKEIT